MPIRFACPECGAQFQAPDHLAGKPVACPKCKKKITVPSSAQPAAKEGTDPAKVSRPANLGANPGGNGAQGGTFSAKHSAEKLPPPTSDSGREQDEAIEAFISQEREKEEAARATTIDFNCSNCDEPLKMPMEMGGKQAPCPACSRIIKVPMPKRTDGAAWKANLNQGPAAVRRDLEPVPEGMQGGARAEVSRETLEEADAVIARPRAPIPIKTRIRNAVTWGLWGAAAALALGVYLYIRSTQQTTITLQKVVANAEASANDWAKDQAQAKILLRLVAAQTLLPVSDDVPGFFKKYTDPTIAELRALKTEYGSEPEKWPSLDVLHAQLILLLMKMGGNAEEFRLGKKAKWDDVQQRIQASYAEMTLPELRLSVWKKVCRDLVAAKESTRLMAMFNQCFPKNQPTRKNRMGEEVPERSDACGIMGLEFFTQGDKPGAGKALILITRVSPPPKPSEVGEHAIALALLASEGNNALPSTTIEGDLDTQVLGQVRGYAIGGNLDLVTKLITKYPQMGFRARVILASLKPDDATLLGQVAQELGEQTSRTESSVAVMRWCDEVGPSGLNPEAIHAALAKMPANSIQDRELMGWCRYLISSRKPGSLKGVPVAAGLPLGELLRFAASGEKPQPAPEEPIAKVIGPFLSIGEVLHPDIAK